MEDNELRTLVDRELERLHKVVDAGKEVSWATAEISRLNKLILHPPMIYDEKSGKVTFLGAV